MAQANLNYFKAAFNEKYPSMERKCKDVLTYLLLGPSLLIDMTNTQ